MRLAVPSHTGAVADPEVTAERRPVRTVDYHTGGEPFRIVAEPPVALPGETVAERRVLAMADPEADGLRQVLCFEPRGHADMYGCFITPPDDAAAHFGALFWHKDGFSTACGHGTIALGAWAVRHGLVDAPPAGQVDVVIDVPSGRVTARVHLVGGIVRSVDFVSVASFVMARGLAVATSFGDVVVDLAFGGATYAHLEASAVGLSVEPALLPDLIRVGREVKWALNDRPEARHPSDGRLSGVYGTVVHDDLGLDPQGRLHQRNVTIFADGEVDRSPCGSGTASRVAALAESGALVGDQVLVHDSLVGSRFLARIESVTTLHGRPAVVPVISGMAYQTGEHVFTVDEDDPMVPGFVLR